MKGLTGGVRLVPHLPISRRRSGGEPRARNAATVPRSSRRDPCARGRERYSWIVISSAAPCRARYVPATRRAAESSRLTSSTLRLIFQSLSSPTTLALISIRRANSRKPTMAVRRSPDHSAFCFRRFASAARPCRSSSRLSPRSAPSAVWAWAKVVCRSCLCQCSALLRIGTRPVISRKGCPARSALSIRSRSGGARCCKSWAWPRSNYRRRNGEGTRTTNCWSCVSLN